MKTKDSAPNDRQQALPALSPLRYVPYSVHLKLDVPISECKQTVHTRQHPSPMAMVAVSLAVCVSRRKCKDVRPSASTQLSPRCRTKHATT